MLLNILLYLILLLCVIYLIFPYVIQLINCCQPTFSRLQLQRLQAINFHYNTHNKHWWNISIYIIGLHIKYVPVDGVNSRNSFSSAAPSWLLLFFKFFCPSIQFNLVDLTVQRDNIGVQFDSVNISVISDAESLYLSLSNSSTVIKSNGVSLGLSGIILQSNLNLGKQRKSLMDLNVHMNIDVLQYQVNSFELELVGFELNYFPRHLNLATNSIQLTENNSQLLTLSGLEANVLCNEAYSDLGIDLSCFNAELLIVPSLIQFLTNTTHHNNNNDAPATSKQFLPSYCNEVRCKVHLNQMTITVADCTHEKKSLINSSLSNFTLSSNLSSTQQKGIKFNTECSLQRLVVCADESFSVTLSYLSAAIPLLSSNGDSQFQAQKLSLNCFNMDMRVQEDINCSIIRFIQCQSSGNSALQRFFGSIQSNYVNSLKFNQKKPSSSGHNANNLWSSFNHQIFLHTVSLGYSVATQDKLKNELEMKLSALSSQGNATHNFSTFQSLQLFYSANQLHSVCTAKKAVTIQSLALSVSDGTTIECHMDSLFVHSTMELLILSLFLTKHIKYLTKQINVNDNNNSDSKLVLKQLTIDCLHMIAGFTQYTSQTAAPLHSTHFIIQSNKLLLSPGNLRFNHFILAIEGTPLCYTASLVVAFSPGISSLPSLNLLFPSPFQAFFPNSIHLGERIELALSCWKAFKSLYKNNNSISSLDFADLAVKFDSSVTIELESNAANSNSSQLHFYSSFHSFLQQNYQHNNLFQSFRPSCSNQIALKLRARDVLLSLQCSEMLLNIDYLIGELSRCDSDHVTAPYQRLNSSVYNNFNELWGRQVLLRINHLSLELFGVGKLIQAELLQLSGLLLASQLLCPPAFELLSSVNLIANQCSPIHLPKSVIPLKFYHDFTVDLENSEINYSAYNQLLFHSSSAALSRLSLPSTMKVVKPLQWFDDLRYKVHGSYRINLKNSLKLRLLAAAQQSNSEDHFELNVCSGRIESNEAGKWSLALEELSLNLFSPTFSRQHIYVTGQLLAVQHIKLFLQADYSFVNPSYCSHYIHHVFADHPDLYNSSADLFQFFRLKQANVRIIAQLKNSENSMNCLILRWPFFSYFINFMSKIAAFNQQVLAAQVGEQQQPQQPSLSSIVKSINISLSVSPFRFELVNYELTESELDWHVEESIMNAVRFDSEAISLDAVLYSHHNVHTHNYSFKFQDCAIDAVQTTAKMLLEKDELPSAAQLNTSTFDSENNFVNFSSPSGEYISPFDFVPSGFYIELFASCRLIAYRNSYQCNSSSNDFTSWQQLFGELMVLNNSWSTLENDYWNEINKDSNYQSPSSSIVNIRNQHSKQCFNNYSPAYKVYKQYTPSKIDELVSNDYHGFSVGRLLCPLLLRDYNFCSHNFLSVNFKFLWNESIRLAYNTWMNIFKFTIHNNDTTDNNPNIPLHSPSPVKPNPITLTSPIKIVNPTNANVPVNTDGNNNPHSDMLKLLDNGEELHILTNCSVPGNIMPTESASPSVLSNLESFESSLSSYCASLVEGNNYSVTAGGQQLFSMDFIRPQINFQSDNTNSRLVLTAKEAKLASKGLPITIIKLQQNSNNGYSFLHSNHLPGIDSWSSWNSTLGAYLYYEKQILAELIDTQAFVAPINIDIGEKLHWVKDSLICKKQGEERTEENNTTEQQSMSALLHFSPAHQASPPQLQQQDNNQINSFSLGSGGSRILRNIIDPCSLNYSSSKQCDIDHVLDNLHLTLIDSTHGIVYLNPTAISPSSAHHRANSSAARPASSSSSPSRHLRSNIEFNLSQLICHMESHEYFTLINTCYDLFIKPAQNNSQSKKQYSSLHSNEAMDMDEMRRIIQHYLEQKHSSIEAANHSSPISRIFKYSVGDSSWSLLEHDRAYITAQLSSLTEIHEFYTDTSRSTDISIAAFTLNSQQSSYSHTNHFSGHILLPQPDKFLNRDEKRDFMISLRNKTIAAHIKSNQHQDFLNSATIYDHFELNVFPLKLELRTEDYKFLVKYFLPNQKLKKKSKKTRRIHQENDGGNSPKANDFFKFHSKSKGNKKLNTNNEEIVMEANTVGEHLSLVNSAESDTKRRQSFITSRVNHSNKSTPLKSTHSTSSSSADSSSLDYSYFRHVRLNELDLCLTYRSSEGTSTLLDFDELQILISPFLVNRKLWNWSQFISALEKHIIYKVLGQSKQIIANKIKRVAKKSKKIQDITHESQPSTTHDNSTHHRTISASSPKFSSSIKKMMTAADSTASNLMSGLHNSLLKLAGNHIINSNPTEAEKSNLLFGKKVSTARNNSAQQESSMPTSPLSLTFNAEDILFLQQQNS
jgi:hypothetical protein